MLINQDNKTINKRISQNLPAVMDISTEKINIHGGASIFCSLTTHVKFKK